MFEIKNWSGKYYVVDGSDVLMTSISRDGLDDIVTMLNDGIIAPELVKASFGKKALAHVRTLSHVHKVLIKKPYTFIFYGDRKVRCVDREGRRKCVTGVYDFDNFDVIRFNVRGNL